MPCRELKRGRGTGNRSDLFAGCSAPHSFGEENDGFANEEAVQIDEEVFFYTDDANLTSSDDELVAELKESNPEWFD